ncbi:MAG: FAD-dependent oxidoreductase [Clostridiales bacterium]|jgi:fumarate reductase flavoprotein subunit|nr:FAD-dependent oxidoreductase [Clostridiales bacterium]
MKKAQKVTAILLCLLMTMGMLACQPAPAEPNPQPSSEPAPEEPAPAETEPGFIPGIYSSVSKGMYGDVPVSVTVSETTIEAISVGENIETLGVGDIAAELLPGRIIETQSLAVDVVTGATITSYAIIDATKKALTEAGGDIAALTEAQPTTPLEVGEAEEVDVVIVGAGLAGINAAYDLKLKNPDISYILLEKRDVITGSLPLSGGTIFATTSKLHEPMGLESSISDVIQLMEYAAGGPVRNELITAIYSNSEELFNRLYDWGAPYYTEENYYNPYTTVNPIPSNSSANANVYTFFSNGSGGGYARFYYDLIAKDPINLRTHSEVTDLLVSDGRVTGVKVQDREKEYEIHAKAVLLTTGGFGSNPAYVEEYSPNYVGGINRSNSGAMGDGIALTRQFGTEVVGNSMISGGLRASYTLDAIGSTFIVASTGERVGNEANTFEIVNVLTSGTDTLYMLFDSKFANADKLQEHLAAGLVEPYDTLEELAEAKGIDAAALVATVIAYNEAIDAGESPGLGLPVERAIKLDTAPYYAERIYNSWSGSVPGIKVDDLMRVLDGSDQPIPGLYAAGELTTGNMYYGGFPGLGVAGSYATYSGPYATRNIADELR